MIHMVAEQMMRPISRSTTSSEHEKPWDFINMMWNVSKTTSMTGSSTDGKDKDAKKEGKPRPPSARSRWSSPSRSCRWGDAGLYLSIPNPGLGGAAVAAAGTPEQKERFLARFKGGKPKWGAMAITEPALRLGLRRHPDDGGARRRPLGAERHEDLLHQRPMARGEVGRLRRGLGDARPSAGRAGIKAFVVEPARPACT